MYSHVAQSKFMLNCFFPWPLIFLDGNCFLVVFSTIRFLFCTMMNFFFDEITVEMAKFASCCGIQCEFQVPKNDIKTNVVEKFMQFQWNTN